jgi:hypothetical protein
MSAPIVTTSIISRMGRFNIRQYNTPTTTHWRIEWKGSWGVEESVRIFDYAQVMTACYAMLAQDAARSRANNGD